MKHATLLLLLCAATLHAATLSVTTNADSGAGSLRAQIAAAVSGDTVNFSITGSIALTTGEILVSGKNLVLTGPGANNLTVTTNGTTRALHFINSQSTISGLTFDNCKGLIGDVDTGGAIAVDNFSSGGGTNVTTISDCVFSNNQSGWGGAVDVFNGGLAMTRCTFTGNSCTGLAFGTNGGGGALSLGPTVASTITNCTFANNTQNGSASGQPGGGAIYNYGSGSSSTPPAVTVEHCTFSGNVDAAGAAGAIRGNYTASYHTAAALRNCLLVKNQAPANALKNFAGNATGSLTASFTSLGGNVTDEATTSAQFMPAGVDKVNNATMANAVSTTLAFNGGSTSTLAILRGSPAQHAGQASTVTTDQRGAPRHAVADAGAYELIEPQMSVTVNNAVAVPESGAITFGSTPVNNAVAQTVTITNTETSPYASGPLSVGGFTLPAGYGASALPSGSLSGGQSASFTITLQASNVGVFNAPLTFTGNDAYNAALATAQAGAPNAHIIQLSGTVTDTADHWRQTIFGPAATNSGNAADNASPAGDGISNLMKYSLGLDPTVAYQGTTPGVTVDFTPSGELRMTVTRNPTAADVTFVVETSSDLVNWSSNAITVDQNSTNVLQAHDAMNKASTTNRFIRLRVVRP